MCCFQKETNKKEINWKISKFLIIDSLELVLLTKPIAKLKEVKAVWIVLYLLSVGQPTMQSMQM